MLRIVTQCAALLWDDIFEHPAQHPSESEINQDYDFFVGPFGHGVWIRSWVLEARKPL